MKRRIEAWAVDRPGIGVKIFALKEDAVEWRKWGEVFGNKGSLHRLVRSRPRADTVLRHLSQWRKVNEHWERSDWEDLFGTEMVDAIEAWEAARGKRRAKR